jgi:hypothetical protein
MVANMVPLGGVESSWSGRDGRPMQSVVQLVPPSGWRSLHVWKGAELDWGFHARGPLDFCTECSLDLIDFLLEFQKMPVDGERQVTLKASVVKRKCLEAPMKQLKGKD